MPNTDNKYGTFNKKSTIFTQKTEFTPLRTFDSVNEALSHFFTPQAIAVYNECSTQIQWALMENSTKLHLTISFGTKGGNVSPTNDWAEQYNIRKRSLMDADNWTINGFTHQETNNHLF